MTGLTAKLNIGWTPSRLTILFLWWMARTRPSVLAHYVTDSLRYKLVERGFPSSASRHLTEVRNEFEALAAQGQFKERWFDRNIVPWCVSLSGVLDRSDSVRILEIGSWEGRSTLFLLTYFSQGPLTAVDTWAGSDEHHYNATSDLRDLEARFDANLGPHAARVTKRKGSSLYVLPQLVEEQREYDLIYVDASHLADDAFTDTINAWRLLAEGGVMIFDDVMWPAYRRPRANTAWAIHSFLNYHSGEFKVLHAGYQVIVQKRVAFNDSPAEWNGPAEVHGDVMPESLNNTH
jgi:predicted O-methyltransferase YrrM